MQRDTVIMLSTDQEHHAVGISIPVPIATRSVKIHQESPEVIVKNKVSRIYGWRCIYYTHLLFPRRFGVSWRSVACSVAATTSSSRQQPWWKMPVIQRRRSSRINRQHCASLLHFTLTTGILHDHQV